MNNAFTFGRRAFAAAIAAITILSTVGIAAFATPASAQSHAPGDLIKGSTLSAVYFYSYDGARYTFPDEKTYMTWFDDFNDVETIDDADLADITLAGNAVYRPGGPWIKITSAAESYAVSRDGMIHWIETEQVAEDFAGSDWNTMIQDVPDVFFVDYTSGASLMTATIFDGAMYMDGGNYYLAWDGERRMVTEAGRAGNDMEDRFFLDGAGIDDSALTDGSDVTGHECDLQDAAQTGCVEVLGGQLTVSLSSSSPSADDVPNSANSFEAAVFKLTAGDAVTLETLAVELTGLSDTDAIANNGVYLYEGGVRLTDGRTVNSSTRKATFAGLNMDFSAGQMRELSVLVDMDSTNTDGTFGFKIHDANDVMTNGTVGGSFPVEGAIHDIIDLDIGEITIEDQGSFSDPTIGEQDATIAEFNVEADGTEHVEIHRMTFEVRDSDDHSDYQLYQDNNWLTECEDIGSDLILCDMGNDPFFLEEGTDRNFSITADIGTSGSASDGDILGVWVDNDADILAIGTEFLSGVSVVRNDYDGGTDDTSEDGGNCAADGDDCSFSNLEGGEVTISFNGPSAGDVKNDADQVTFYEFAMTAQRFSEIQEMAFIIDGDNLLGPGGATTDRALEDIRVVDCDTDTLISGPEELDLGGSDTTQTLTFTDNFFLDAGETLNLCGRADINDAVAVEGETFTFTLDISAFDIEDDQGDAITDIVPGADLVGHTQTVEDASLVVSLASSPSGDTDYVRQAQDVLAAGFNFLAGTGSDIEVIDTQVTVFVDENGGTGFVQGEEGDTEAEERIDTCSVYDGADDTLIAGPESPSDSGDVDGVGGEMDFENFSWWITAGNTGNMEVICDLHNVDPGVADVFAFEIVAAGTDVDAKDDEGSSVTPTGSANTGEDVTITINTNGDLTLAEAANVPDAEYLITGSDDNHVSSFQFISDDEAFKIDEITVAEEQGEADDGAADSDIYANNVEMVTIKYLKEDTSTGEMSSALTGNEHTFRPGTGEEIWVPKDDSSNFDIYVDASESDRKSGSATSNERIKMGISTDTGLDDQFRALGASSGEELDDDDIDPDVAAANAAQETWVVRETVPTIDLHALSPSGTGHVPGDQEVLRFTVAAHANEDVVLENILFEASLSDAAGSSWNICDGGATGEVTASDFDLYEDGDTSDPLDASDAEWTLYAADGSVCTDDTDVVEYAKVALATPEVVAAGAAATVYNLYFDSANADAGDDSVQFGIEGDPISGTFLDVDTLTLGNNPTQDPTDNDITLSGAGEVALGDVLCVDIDGDSDLLCDGGNEAMLVVVDAGTSLQVVRGYLGTDVGDPAATDEVWHLPGGLLWQDDGISSVTLTDDDGNGYEDVSEERYGAWLADFLPLDGHSVGF